MANIDQLKGHARNKKNIAIIVVVVVLILIFYSINSVITGLTVYGE